MNKKFALTCLIVFLPLISGCSQSERIAALERENAALQQKAGGNAMERLERNEKCKTYGVKEIGADETTEYSMTFHEHFYSPSLDTCISVRRANFFPSEIDPKGKEMVIIFDAIKTENLFGYQSWCRDTYNIGNGYTQRDIEVNCPYDQFSIEDKVNELRQ